GVLHRGCRRLGVGDDGDCCASRQPVACDSTVAIGAAGHIASTQQNEQGAECKDREKAVHFITRSMDARKKGRLVACHILPHRLDMGCSAAATRARIRALLKGTAPLVSGRRTNGPTPQPDGACTLIETVSRKGLAAGTLRAWGRLRP